MSVASTDEQSLEARTLRKVIIRAVPFLMAPYFVNYLDRTNLGIAKADISEHLQLTSTMFGLASGIFFIGYVLVPYATGALNQFTGNDKAGMWAVGVFMVISAVVVVALRATPDPGLGSSPIESAYRS